MPDRPCGQDGRHDAPEPVDQPTTCPCGTRTRMPTAVPPEEPR